MNTTFGQQNSQDSFLFLKKFLQHGSRIASISPTSQSLALEMCRHIQPNQSQVILELGAGTGAVTSVAEQQMNPSSTLIAIELDSDFVRRLRKRCPSAHIIQTNAANIQHYLNRLGITHIDVVINCLPTPSLPMSINRSIFECLRTVAQDSPITQLTVMPWVYLRFYRRLFHEVVFQPIWRNIPSGGVYHCRKPREVLDFLLI